jgi:hypothetical protein
MARYIDADVEVSKYVTVWDCDCSEFGEQTVMAVDDLHYLPTADVAPRAEWISVEERLPEVDGRQYLVWDDVQATVKKRFFYRIPPNIPLETYPHIREYFGNVSDHKRFTHWMPLPEPPKGEKHDPA